MAPFLCSNLPKDDLVFEEIVPTLEDIAAFNVALLIWHHSLYRVTLNDNILINVRKTSAALKTEAKKYMKQLNVPPRIHNLINQSFHTITRKIYHWANETCFDVLDVENLRARPLHMKCLVWKPNLEIDYEKTARRILSHPDGFTQVEKFSIMSQFCWKEDIEALVPDVELQQFMEEVYSKSELFFDSPAMYYWICYLKNTIHDGSIEVEPPYNSVEMFMLSEYFDLSLATEEYFWNFVPEEDQVTVAINLLENNEKVQGHSHQKAILSKLNNVQKHAVLSEIPHNVIVNFIRSSNLEDARYVWTRIENSVTNDEFVTLMENILRVATCECCRSYFLGMAELFKTASKQHRDYYCLYGRSDIINLFFNRNKESYTRRDKSLPLLSAILDGASPTYRRDIILEYGDVLFVDYYPSKEVMKLIKFCLPDSSDVAKFKLLVRKSTFIKKRYANLFRCCMFTELVQYLESYFPEEPILKNLMKCIIDENDLEDSSVLGNREGEIIKLLNIVYNNDVGVVKNIAKKLIPSFEWSDDSQSNFENGKL